MHEIKVNDTRIRLVRGDITEECVDAIVNAANSSLLGGGGVDGAIHRKGGSAILEECREIRNARGSLPTGEAVITTAGELPAKHVIHTVGPVWNDGNSGEDQKLRNAYESSLELAAENELRTVAFPSISTGAYRFPIDRASVIALTALLTAAQQHPEAFDEVRMVLFSQEDFEQYEKSLDEVRTDILGD